MRAMTRDERELALRILNESGRSNADSLQDQMVRQLAPEDFTSYHIIFVYTDKPVPEGGFDVVKDWRAKDKDGAALELLALGGSDGRLYEIEISRLDQSPILELPAASMWA
jgi:hypothetical protein